MNGRSQENKKEIIIGKCEWERLRQKAEEMDEDITTILEWLIEEHLDEL